MDDTGSGTGGRGRSPDATRHHAGSKARLRPADGVIPELQAKLGLLVRSGCFDSFKAIAATLGRRPKTVRWWAHGDAARHPGRVPADRYRQVVALLKDCLAPDVPESLAEEIVLGPARWMEERLKAGDLSSIRDYVEREGDARAGRLFVGREGEIGLVETEQERPAAAFQVPLDAWFRMVIEKDLRRRHVVALQLAPSACGIVPHAVDPGTGHVLLPGLKPDGRPAHMRERRDDGVNRFAVIGVDRPLPADIPSDAGQGLSEALQDRLGHLYGQQPRAGREIHLLTVDIRRPG